MIGINRYGWFVNPSIGFRIHGMIKSMDIENNKNDEESSYFFDLKYKHSNTGKNVDKINPSNLVPAENADADAQKIL